MATMHLSAQKSKALRRETSETTTAGNTADEAKVVQYGADSLSGLNHRRSSEHRSGLPGPSMLENPGDMGGRSLIPDLLVKFARELFGVEDWLGYRRE